MNKTYKKNNPELRQPKMQHIRNVKPEFFAHEGVAEMSVAARLGWIGIWTMADKFGRFEWKPKTLKLRIFPFDENIDFESLLQEMVKQGFVESYEVAGQKYGRVVNWERHQGIATHEKRSGFEYPAPQTHAQEQFTNCSGTVPDLCGNSAVQVGIGVGVGVGVEKGICEGTG